MPYLIDGHNLIPKLPGLSLSAIDDETELITLLQEFCRITRKQVEVYFDNAPAGHAGRRVYGVVAAHFIPQGRTVDDAICARLSRLGRGARNWIVVSSDQRVQTCARAAHAQAIPAEAFARQLRDAGQVPQGKPQPPEAPLGPEEVDAWLEIFSRRPGKLKKPRGTYTENPC